MSFGVGMGAGIGAGIAIGVSTGRKRACGEIREHLYSNGLTIHDRTGKEVDVDEVLAAAARSRCSGNGLRTVGLLILLGIVIFGVMAYLNFN